MSGGVFAIARSIWTDPDFAEEKVFSERMAFIWLVSEAAWRDRTVRGVRGPVHLKRGEICHSLRFMGEAWGWKKDKVARFIKRLQHRHIIRDTSREGEKVYFLNKYNKFQVVGLPERDTECEANAKPPRNERDKLETGKQGNTVSNETGVPPDCRSQLFGPVKDWLVSEHGISARNAGGFLGKCLKLTGDDAGSLLDLFRQAHEARPADVQSWVMARLIPKENSNGKSAKPHSTILAGFGEALRRTGSVALRDTDASGGGRSGAPGNALGRGAGEGTPRQIEAPRGGQRSEGAGYGRAHGGVPRSAD